MFFPEMCFAVRDLSLAFLWLLRLSWFTSFFRKFHWNSSNLLNIWIFFSSIFFLFRSFFYFFFYFDVWCQHLTGYISSFFSLIYLLEIVLELYKVIMILDQFFLKYEKRDKLISQEKMPRKRSSFLELRTL